jgi:hypothetical protein
MGVVTGDGVAESIETPEIPPDGDGDAVGVA